MNKGRKPETVQRVDRKPKTQKSLPKERRPENDREPVICPHMNQRPMGDQESKDLSSTGLKVKQTIQRVRRFKLMESYVFL